MQALYDQALIEESAKKSSLVWLSAAGNEGASTRVNGAAPASRAVWHVWLDGAVTIVAGGGEQPLPTFVAADKVVEVCVRSKDNGSRLVTWLSQVQILAPGTPEWDAAAAALHAERLNLPEGDPYLERWAADSVIVRLKPLGELLPQPEGSGAARPAASAGTTLGRQPKMVGGLPRRSR